LLLAGKNMIHLGPHQGKSYKCDERTNKKDTKGCGASSYICIHTITSLLKMGLYCSPSGSSYPNVKSNLVIYPNSANVPTINKRCKTRRRQLVVLGKEML